MIRELKIKWITWIDWFDLEKKDIYSVLKDYDFHELNIEACMEENQRARIDTYDDYSFMVFHFPKYNKLTWIYDLDEFNVFLKKDTIITLRNFTGSHIDIIFNKYLKLDFDEWEENRLYSGYILYEIIESMLEKMFNLINNVNKDLKSLEKQVFENTNHTLVKKIMIKKRNVVILKHMFTPQFNVMYSIEENINTLFKWEIEKYFEDLEDKLSYIINSIKILEEHISDIEDTFKSIIDMNTNNIIKLLTIFSAFILPLTLITSFYWMNIDLPFWWNSLFVYILFISSVILMIFIYLYINKNGKL